MTAILGVHTRLQAWIRQELHQPALRGGYAMLVNTGLTSLLGLVYWVVAARSVSVATLGLAAATIAAIATISGIGTLNLYQSLTVLLPAAGPRAVRMIGGVYGVTATASLVLAMGFLGVSRLLGIDSAMAVGDVGFVLCVVLWTIFALEDGALIAIRQAVVVPTSNAAYGVLKLLLLVWLAPRFGTVAVVVSWYAPILLVAPVVNLLIVRRADLPELPRPPQTVVGFIAVDYAGFLLLQTCTTFLPFLVASVLDAQSAGVFATVWMTVVIVDLLASNLALPMTAEIAHRPAQAFEVLRSVGWRLALVLGFTVGVGVALAPLILRLFGPQYADEGATLLRLMLLGSLPRGFVIVTVALARALRRPAHTVVLEGLLAAVVLSLGILLMRSNGAIGMGQAWVIGQCVTALASVAVMVRLRTHAGDSYELVSNATR